MHLHEVNLDFCTIDAMQICQVCGGWITTYLRFIYHASCNGNQICAFIYFIRLSIKETEML